MRWLLAVVFALIVAMTCVLIDFVPSGLIQAWEEKEALHGKNHFGAGTRTITNKITTGNLVNNSTFPDGVSVTDDIFDGVQVRVYRPRDRSLVYKGVMYYHGGGWIRGDTYRYDHLMADVLQEVKNIVIISVNYRLAPEYKYPAALDDCLIASKHFIRNARKYNVNPEMISISGDSAGGNLAAAVALRLRDEKFSPMPVNQILIYPVLQGVDLSLPSYVQNADKRLTKDFMARIISEYATGSSEYKEIIKENSHVSPKARKEIFKTKIRHDDLPNKYLIAPYSKPDLDQGHTEVWNKLKDVLSSPYFSPLMADNLKGLPDTYVFTSEFDVLRDESLLFIKRLRDAGVRVTHVHGQTNTHATCSSSQIPGQREECVLTFIKFLKKMS